MQRGRICGRHRRLYGYLLPCRDKATDFYEFAAFFEHADKQLHHTDLLPSHLSNWAPGCAQEPRHLEIGLTNRGHLQPNGKCTPDRVFLVFLYRTGNPHRHCQRCTRHLNCLRRLQHSPAHWQRDRLQKPLTDHLHAPPAATPRPAPSRQQCWRQTLGNDGANRYLLVSQTLS